MEPKELQEILRQKLDKTIAKLNKVLQGKNVIALEKTLKRLGRGGSLPHWYEQLRDQNSLPNLDGKTIGSIIEMLFVGILESYTFKSIKMPKININPAKGIDIPELDLGIKSPSENYCTSEPFFSAYERLLGNDHDSVILLTDYQTAKKHPPLKIKILKWEYLAGSQIADKNLCKIAKKHRKWLIKENETHAKKVFRFLCHINQSDWLGKHLLKIVSELDDEKMIITLINEAKVDFDAKNKILLKQSKELIAKENLDCLLKIKATKPIYLGVIDAIDNWVVDTNKEFARMPNENEWNRFKTSPLNGAIGMSFALQWRYNFGSLF